MSKHEVSARFKQAMNDMHLHYHETLYDAIIDHIGEDIHHDDDHLVACSDEKELAQIKEDFLKKELGMTDEDAMDKALQQVCHGMGESNRQKHRSTFYYLLVAVTGNEQKFIETHQ